uniref:Uncharacterized protein n=1 Tax=Coccolithus braarudii TaxID=221442 RepID=A0A7S0LPM8_9EUKA|mmetsp:Transcript_51943/g.111016  ORF Transcript_51943/g.111016 Transcript_51943/m.111016 type:complete len:201 (+) Transcript_51943:71-673(+)
MSKRRRSDDSEAVIITVYAPTGYELWGMVHLRSERCKTWRCGLEHEVDGVKCGRFDGKGSADHERRWPGGEQLVTESVPSVEAGRRIMQRVAARLPAACTARLSDDMQRWESERGTHAETCAEGPRLDGPPFSDVIDGAATCKDSIGYHGSRQMPSMTRGGAFRGGVPRGVVLRQRGEHAHAAGEEMSRLVIEAAQEERS